MDRAVDILDKLIAFPTVSRDGNWDLIRYVADLLAEAGIEARLFPGEAGDRASLFATIGPEGPGGVVLSGHTDVVPVDGQDWTCDPFRMSRRDGRLYGRGTADMKGFCALAIEAMLTADRSALTKPLHLALSYDEEIGCVGVRPMLESLANAGLKPEWVLVGEPTGMQVATGHKGKLGAHAHCHGHAAHSALAPTGLNAIHLATDLISYIRGLQAEFEAQGTRDDAFSVPYTTLHAGIIHGGTALNIVPDHCTLSFEIRNIASDDSRAIFDRLLGEADRLSTAAQARFPETGISVEVFNEYPGLETETQSEAVSRALALSGAEGPMKVSYGTEGGLFANTFGIPVVVCGPGFMDQGHKPDEFVALEQLQSCRAMLSKLVGTLS